MSIRPSIVRALRLPPHNQSLDKQAEKHNSADAHASNTLLIK